MTCWRGKSSKGVLRCVRKKRFRGSFIGIKDVVCGDLKFRMVGGRGCE